MNDFAIKVMTAKQGDTHLFSVGQAGYVVKSKKCQLLGVDLYLSECVERVEGHVGFKRLLPKILSPFDLVFDYVVATHSHFDHFDIDSIPQLMSNRRTKLFASLDCEKEVQRLNMTNDNITYVRAGEKYMIGDFVLEFVLCDHGVAAPDAVGVIITIDGKKIYMTGDTCLRMDRIEELNKKGPFDVIIGPINGLFGNMNEQEFAEFSDALRVKLTIPSHYGMFASHGGNPGKFFDIMRKRYSDNGVLFMAMGEQISL